MIYIGIDPGLGVRSATGIVAIRENISDQGEVRYNLLYSFEVWADKKLDLASKLNYIRTQFNDFLYHLLMDVTHPANLRVVPVAIEYFVMRGKGGESLQRLVGALMSEPSTDPYTELHWNEIQNVVLKKIIGGRGDDSKEAVAKGLLEYFSETSRDTKIIEGWIVDERWDLIDAAALAIAMARLDHGL